MATTQLLPRHITLLKAVIEVTHSSVDWKAVAEKANFPTHKYARDTFANIKHKLLVSSGKVDLTPKQMQLVKAYVAMMNGTTDWTAVATKAEFKTPKYARDTFAQVKKKLNDLQGSGADAADDDTATAAEAKPAAKTKTAAKSRKRKDISEEPDEAAAKPSKRKRKDSAVKAEEADEAESDRAATAATPVKPEAETGVNDNIEDGLPDDVLAATTEGETMANDTTEVTAVEETPTTTQNVEAKANTISITLGDHVEVVASAGIKTEDTAVPAHAGNGGMALSYAGTGDEAADVASGEPEQPEQDADFELAVEYQETFAPDDLDIIL